MEELQNFQSEKIFMAQRGLMVPNYHFDNDSELAAMSKK